MMNKTRVLGSMFAAGCVLLSAQSSFGQDAQPTVRQKAGAAGRTTAAATGRAAAAGRTTNGKTQDKNLSEASKYQLSIHRTDLIKSIIDGYAAQGEQLSDNATFRMITNDIGKQMTLLPASSLEKADPQSLNDQAKAMVEQEYGTDDKKYNTVVEAEAAVEFPMYKIGDKVTVKYNMGPKFYSVTGILYRVTENAITVDDKVINLIDLNDETRSKFDAQKNKYMRSRYIETHVHLLNRLKLEKIQDNYDKLKADIFKRNETSGYIYDPQSDRWGSAQEIAKAYVDKLIKEQQAKAAARPKPAENPNANPAGDNTPDKVEGQPADTVKTTPGKIPGKTDKPVKVQPAVFGVNDAIKIEDNEQTRQLYEEVIAKAKKQRKEMNDNFAGIDADPGYKNALWGFTIADVRYALWREPEFAVIKPAVGRDSIDFNDSGEQEVKMPEDLPIPPAVIDLIYVSNGLSKVVYSMEDCSRQEFIGFKDSLTEKYGRAAEERGANAAYFNDIFSGKTKPHQIADPDEVKAAKESLESAEKAFNAAEAALKNASDDDRADLQTKRDDAAANLKAAIAKNDEFEDAVAMDSLPYVYSRIKLSKDDKGRTILPYSFTWKGKNVTGTLVFYYNKTKDKVESIVFAKEYEKK